MKLPALALASTRGRWVDLSTLAGTTVVYIYPRTGRPDQELPPDRNADAVIEWLTAVGGG